MSRTKNQPVEKVNDAVFSSLLPIWPTGVILTKKYCVPYNQGFGPLLENTYQKWDSRRYLRSRVIQCEQQFQARSR
jgi:hypothetical protein